MTFIRNTWYCAGWSGDVTRNPINRKFLGESVALFRLENGAAVALSNRCPHRFAPLHLGELKGDRIACPYHGLEFDSAGQCVHNPHGEGHIPKAACVRSFPMAEHDGVLWIWMGDPDKADSAEILDSRYTDFMVDNERVAVGAGDLEVGANYLLVMDNLLDLTHAPYLHRDSVGGKPEDSIGADIQVGFKEDETSVTSSYFVANMKPTPQLQPLYHEDSGDFRIEMRWQPGSNLAMQLTMTPCGQPDGSGIVLRLLHLLTPIDDENTHYFFSLSRNVAIDNDEAQAGMMEFARRAFQDEDEPMIAACQAQMGTTDLFSLKPVLLKTDIANVKARRRVDEIIAAEQSA